MKFNQHTRWIQTRNTSTCRTYNMNKDFITAHRKNNNNLITHKMKNDMTHSTGQKII